MCRSRGRHSTLRTSMCIVCGACCLPRGRMYALASVGHRRSAGNICVLCAALAACQGVRCTPWRRLGTGAGCADFVAGAALCEPSCADFVAGTALCEPPCALCAALATCQGVGCTPWRRLGTGALPAIFACCARRLLLAKGSDVRPGVGWVPALDV